MTNTELGLLTRKQFGKIRWGTHENVYMEDTTMRMSGRKNPVVRTVTDIMQKKEKKKYLTEWGN